MKILTFSTRRQNSLNGVLDETTTANTRGRSSRAHARLCKFTSGSRPSSSRRPVLRSLFSTANRLPLKSMCSCLIAALEDTLTPWEFLTKIISYFSLHSFSRWKKKQVNFSPFSSHWTVLLTFAPTKSWMCKAFSYTSKETISVMAVTLPQTVYCFSLIIWFVSDTRSRNNNLGFDFA